MFGAARKFFGPSYFVTALVTTASLYILSFTVLAFDGVYQELVYHLVLNRDDQDINISIYILSIFSMYMYSNVCFSHDV